MCGIADIMRREASPDQTQVRALAQALKHPGHDGVVIHNEGPVGEALDAGGRHALSVQAEAA